MGAEQQAFTRRFVSEKTHGILQTRIIIVPFGARNVNKENGLEKMKALAATHCQELMKEKYAIGAFLFGSIVSGDNEESDIELAVVYNAVAADVQVGKEERRISDMRLGVWRYPIAPFTGTFEDEKLRDKPDTWMWTSLWIECMQNGVILADPTRRLADWKTRAKQWKWRESEVKPAVEQAKDNVAAAKRYLNKRDPFHSLICLREALTCLSAAYIMKHGLIPSFRPKDLSQKLVLIRDKETELASAYEHVNNTINLDYNLVEGLFVGLKEFIDSEWGARRLGPRSELENARSCLNKNNLIGAMLSLRYSAYWLGFHIINRRETKLRAEICNGENHVKMLDHLKKASEPFYEFYQRLQFTDKWNLQNTDSALHQIQAVILRWSK